MDTGKLTALLETAKCGSINKVAEKLGYTQSGLTYVLNAIEKELGIKLLQRGHSGVSLSPEGKELLPFIESIVSSEENMMQHIQKIKARNSGIIHVGAYNSIVTNFLQHAITAFRIKYPIAQFELTTGVTSLSYLMESQALDIVICEEHIVTNGYNWEPLIDDEMCVIVRKDDPLAKQASISLKELENCHVIYPNINLHGCVANRLLAENIHFRDQTNIVTTDGSTTLRIISHNGGVSFVSRMYESESPDNVVFIPASPKLIRTIGIATPANITSTKAMNSFVAQLKRSAKA